MRVMYQNEKKCHHIYHIMNDDIVDNVFSEIDAVESGAPLPQPQQRAAPPPPQQQPYYDMVQDDDDNAGSFLGVSSGYMKYVAVAAVLSSIMSIPQVSSVLRMVPGVSYAPGFGLPIIVGLVIAFLLWLVEYFEML